MNLYAQLTKNTATKIFVSLVLVVIAVILESKIKLISPIASLLGFYPLILASYLFFHPVATAVLGGISLQFFILHDRTFTFNWSQDIWVHAFIGLGCYCFYRVKQYYDQKFFKLDEKLKREEEQRYFFTQNLGKFIKNHTRIIKQGGVFMKENSPTHEKYQKGLNLLILKTDELDKLADDVLDVSHWSMNGSLDFPLEPLNFRTIVIDVVESYLKSNNQIEFESEQNGTITLLNENAIRRLLDIFIKNALTHGDGTKIRVSYKESEKIINLRVQNTGDIIPEKEIKNLFKGFNKIFQSTQTNQGAGLNLSLAKAITEAHNGSIRVTSNTDEGTIFEVFIPIKKEHSEEQ